MHQCGGMSKLRVKRAAMPHSAEQFLLGPNLLSLLAQIILTGKELKNEKSWKIIACRPNRPHAGIS